MLCRVHNAYQAELDYGKEKLERYRRSRWIDGVSEPAAVYSWCERGMASLHPPA